MRQTVNQLKHWLQWPLTPCTFGSHDSASTIHRLTVAILSALQIIITPIVLCTLNPHIILLCNTIEFQMVDSNMYDLTLKRYFLKRGRGRKKRTIKYIYRDKCCAYKTNQIWHKNKLSNKGGGTERNVRSSISWSSISHTKSTKIWPKNKRSKKFNI